MIPEPEFQNEKELENVLASAIRSLLDSDGVNGFVLQGFGLDLAVFTEHHGMPRARFLEVKAFADHHGRCGFGNHGEGNQIRLLYDETTGTPRTNLTLFDSTVRWVLGNRSLSIGAQRYVLFTCKQAQDAAMGGVRPGKHNNFRLSAFEGRWITWPELIQRIETFIRP